MRRLPTMLASASAAALTALAVTVAVPAIADDPPAAKGEDGLAACLRDNGLDGAPDGAALKPWLGERLQRGDAATHRALEKCSPKPALVKPGPSEQELRSCLKDQGVDIPGGDARALKQWLHEHGDDAASRKALKACDIALVTKQAGPGPCGEGSDVAKPVPTAGAKEVRIFESRVSEVRRAGD